MGGYGRSSMSQDMFHLLDCADPRARALLLLASATGMRFGELRHLKWRDVDPTSLRVHVSAKKEVDWSPGL